MGCFSPKSNHATVANNLVCYDLQFSESQKAQIGYEFSSPSGMMLYIDVDAKGNQLLMTLIHTQGKTVYTKGPKEEFLAAAQEAYLFALKMVTFAQVKKLTRNQWEDEKLQKLGASLLKDAVESIQGVEKFGTQHAMA